MQGQVLEQHPDLYHLHPSGFPAVHIIDGQVTVNSLLQAPFGLTGSIDCGQLLPRAEWRYEMLGLEG